MGGCCKGGVGWREGSLQRRKQCLGLVDPVVGGAWMGDPEGGGPRGDTMALIALSLHQDQLKMLYEDANFGQGIKLTLPDIPLSFSLHVT